MFAHESFALAWFLRILGQSINLVTTASDEDPKPNLSCASAFVRESRTLHSINALRTFYCMHTFLN